MIGQDTEFFVYNTTEGRVVPAHSVGIKKEKTKVMWEGSFFRDGYAVEFNSDPYPCRAGIWEKLARTMNVFQHGSSENGYSSSRISALPNHLKLITDPAADIDLEELKTAPKDLHVLGCNPTLDAYKMEEKRIDINPLELPFRTTGAHLHWSFPLATRLGKSELAHLTRFLDLTIGLPFTIIYGDDKEFRRRTLYGTAGEFREQHYPDKSQGLEYRVLSSRLYHHPAVFGLFTGIFKYLLKNYTQLLAISWNEKLSEPLQVAINTGEGAVELLEEFSKVLSSHKKVLYEPSGMSGLGYIPEDWGKAILALREKRKNEGILDKFQMWDGQLQAHWGWSEYNDHASRASTVSHTMLIEEESWHL